MIDLEAYQRQPDSKYDDSNRITLGIDSFVGRCSCESCNNGDMATNSRKFNVTDCIPLSNTEVFTDEMKLLFPSYTYGFVLKERRWGESIEF